MITHKLLKQEFSVTDGRYKILCDVENGLLTITTMQGKQFNFINSKPEVVKAIGELINYCGELTKDENS